MKMRSLFCGILLCVACSISTDPAPQPTSSQRAEGEITYVLPDFKPRWASDSLADIRFDTARSNDRRVSCSDWTQVDDTPITGQRVLSFTLGSPNYGFGHFRTRRTLGPDGWDSYQRISYLDKDLMCGSEEYYIGTVPVGPGQSGRWLPLGSFTLWTEGKDGGLGEPIVCQMKRWCCLISIPTCALTSPCALPCQGDCINAGTRDTYPFHFLDQFIPVEGIPSGRYWVQHTINPANIFFESDYDNNSIFFKIDMNQEAGTVTVIEAPDPPQCPT